MKFPKIVKQLFLAGVAGSLLAVFAVYGSNMLVEHASTGRIYDSTEAIPHNKVGLLLGTGKILKNGRVNLYYQYRIDAAVELYKSGKIDVILVSGDNSRKDYDEPTTIKEDLMARGIPEKDIVLDYAGFRTLDSVVRSHEIFGQHSITVISQPFHNERAISIAQWKDLEAIGYNARDVSGRYGLKVQLREKFARVRMVLDLMTNKQPKFLGEKIEIA